MGNMKSSMLNQLQKNVEKKTKKSGISQYLGDDDDSADDDFDDEDGGENKNMSGETDPSKLCDLELIKLLKFCDDLKNKYKETDEHQEEVMMKSLELGKKTKEKTLILDMDETLIAAKFDGKEPAKFKPTFSYDFSGVKIHVRLRPYLADTLEKLA